MTVVALFAFIGSANAHRPVFKVAALGHGITLHYAQEGAGRPVVFVHGSLTDYRYWAPEVDAFSKHYRAIAYSRRYNVPNHNPAIAGYSAVTDADDLAAFIRALGLRHVEVIGHSYGALTALFLALRHPELIDKLVLTEPPAVSLLKGTPMYGDIQRRMVLPMQRAFRSGHREAGVAIFIDYVFGNPHAWDEMSEEDRESTMQDAHEWDVMMTRGTLFPQITPAQVRSIQVPTLILTGAKTYPFLNVIDGDLARLLPHGRQVFFAHSGHQMWYQQARDCREAVEAFLQ
ncbi:MAG TPA: alpha/beta hydrolase [Candidatus Baltobacteraceae bacterium]|nr:alpha/beta hydrolase [Candidatus Baltobacteraceae bacterium]